MAGAYGVSTIPGVGGSGVGGGNLTGLTLDQMISQITGVQPILTADFSSNTAWLRGRAMPASSLPGRSHTRASSANGQSRDGVWSVFGSGVARDVPGRGQLDEVLRANKCTNYNAAPNGSLTNVTKFGDAAATLTEVDDSAALLAAGLQNLCPSGKVFKLDNTAGVAAAVAWCAGATANTNAHTASAYVRGGTGSFAQYSAGGTPFGAWGASSSYVRRVGTFTPVDASRVCAIVADAGQIVYFILNQLEEGSFVTSPIVVAGASATRAADVATIDLLNPGLYDVSGQPELAPNGGFNSDISGWAATGGNASASWSAGKLRVTSSANLAAGVVASTAITTVVGRLYRFAFDFVTDAQTGNSFAYVGTSSGGNQNLNANLGSTLGSYAFMFRATSTTTYLVFGTSSAALLNDYIELDNVSLKEVPAEQVIDYPCTIVVGFEPAIISGAEQGIVCLEKSGGLTDVVYFYQSLAGAGTGLIYAATAAQMSATGAAFSAGNAYKLAMRVAANDGRYCQGGTLATLDNSVTLPNAPDRILIGQRYNLGGFQACGYISFISIIRGGVIDDNLKRLAP